jgi:hypothetical protein
MTIELNQNQISVLSEKFDKLASTSYDITKSQLGFCTYNTEGTELLFMGFILATVGEDFKLPCSTSAK